MSTRRRALALGALAAVVLAAGSLAASSAAAQAPEQVTAPSGEVAPVPAGPATIRGRVVHPGEPTAGADLPVALYALGADGRPGLSGTRSDAEGRFVFENVSNDTSTVYLVGTQYADVPFGRRIAFEPGQTELTVELPLRAVSTDGSALLVVATTYKLDWLGSQLFVQVAHQLQNGADEVIFVGESARSGRRPLLRSRLPAGVVEFVDGEGGLVSGLVRDGDDLAFWGPVYPGEQEVRYGFVIDGPAADDATDDARDAGAARPPLELAFVLPDGSGEVQLMTQAADPRPTGPGVRALEERIDVDGVAYVRASLGGVSPGGRVAFSWPLPGASHDDAELRIASATYWVDLDDAAMRVTGELALDVAGGQRLVARAGESLLRLDWPEGAELTGLSGAAGSLGAEPRDGSLLVRGPLPPGRSSIGFRYQIPVAAGETGQLDLAFERAVGVLNVAVADTGVVVESPRLHRQRPFKSGTRTYLHRQAFQLEPGERVEITLEPLSRSEAPRGLVALGGLLLAAAAAALLIAPLRAGRRAAAPAAVVDDALATERETIYEALRDLEHDHETGKVEDGDYTRLRGELRASAVELIRRQRAGTPTADAPAQAVAGTACPGCGARAERGWRFCAKCGAPLAGADGGAAV